jgi:sugar lactone lactonase YvrE
MASTPSANEPRILADGFILPEGPRWRGSRLWFSDVYKGDVWSIDMRGQKMLVAKFDDFPAGLGFLPDGSLIVALQKSQRLMRVVAGKAVLHADLSPLGGHHLNDMIVDDAGRAYVDLRMVPVNLKAPAPDPAETRADTIALVQPSGDCSIAARGLLTPNGLAITADGEKLIVAETRGCRLLEIDREADSGQLGEARLFADLGDVRPDGMCLDAEGAAWIGALDRSRFMRVVRGRGMVSFIDCPGKFAIACVLGGEDRRTLFMMTTSTTWEKIGRHQGEGFVEVVTVDVPGAGLP